MTWEGYNYEDAVLLNEKIVRADVYTSIHIEEYDTCLLYTSDDECAARFHKRKIAHKHIALFNLTCSSV